MKIKTIQINKILNWKKNVNYQNINLFYSIKNIILLLFIIMFYYKYIIIFKILSF